jgi:SH3-like domain-containing protein
MNVLKNIILIVIYFVLSTELIQESKAYASETSGLPLPRFVSLRSDEVNMRTGPGVRYPIDWVYARRDMPVEVISEFETWRKIRDWQGSEGWVHKTMLSAKRTVVVTTLQRRLRAEPEEKSPNIALIDVNAIGRVIACPKNNDYCHLSFLQLKGWMKRNEIWGITSSEVIE